MRQDRATFQKTSVAGLHILKCLFYMVDNIHLTTLTQHVMVGITRSKVIFFGFGSALAMPESMLSLLLEIDASAGVAIDEQRHSRNGIINLRHIYIYILINTWARIVRSMESEEHGLFLFRVLSEVELAESKSCRVEGICAFSCRSSNTISSDAKHSKLIVLAAEFHIPCASLVLEFS